MPATNPDKPSSLDIEDHAALAKYLADTQNVSPHGFTFETLAGGVSNKTVLVNFPNGHGWVIKQALAKLRTKADWFSDPSRVHREALGIRWLEKLLPAGSVAGFVFEDFDHHLLAMHAVPQPHENWKSMLLAGNLQPNHVLQFATLLADMHRGAAESHEPLREIFSDRQFFEALRLEPYYAFTAQHAPPARDFMLRLIDETRHRSLGLVHGDYSPKNILVHEGRLILLDHEVIHWGDPAFDLGFALSHLLSKANHLRSRVFAKQAEQFFLFYSRRVGPDIAKPPLLQMIVRHTLGCLLARVDGRSPLEYLSVEARDRQRRACLELMRVPIETFDELIRGFAIHTGIYEQD
jgi:aminoglycoside phosphotransferase (APT) family kinase protein